jgi:hypothetical protein
LPTHIRMQVSWNVGSSAPRDVMQITPCFRAQEDWSPGGTDYEDLAQDLADALDTWNANDRKLTVKAYKIQDPVPGEPHRPEAIATTSQTSILEAPIFREQALCLSFYGGQNGPRQRGRLYLPAFMLSVGQPDVRPSTAFQQKALDLVPIFAGLGGSNVDWIVWSPTNKSATKVTNAYVDDEWDVQRRRGLRPVTRLEATTGG